VLENQWRKRQKSQNLPNFSRKRAPYRDGKEREQQMEDVRET
jgi:hypothetical protein